MATNELNYLRIAQLLGARAAQGRRARFGGLNAYAWLKASQFNLESEATTQSVGEADLRVAYEEFEKIRNGYELDRVLIDPQLSVELMRNIRSRGVTGVPAKKIFRALQAVRKVSSHGMKFTKATRKSGLQVDTILPTAEVAFSQLLRVSAVSVDDVITDPAVAIYFDSLFRSLDPLTSPLEARWALLSLRKRRVLSQKRWDAIDETPPENVEAHFSDGELVETSVTSHVPHQRGLFRIMSDNHYVYTTYVNDIASASFLFRQPELYRRLSTILNKFWQPEVARLRFSFAAAKATTRYGNLTNKEAALALIHHRRPYLNASS